jgi:hypothetical protein
VKDGSLQRFGSYLLQNNICINLFSIFYFNFLVKSKVI